MSTTTNCSHRECGRSMFPMSALHRLRDPQADSTMRRDRLLTEECLKNGPPLEGSSRSSNSETRSQRGSQEFRTSHQVGDYGWDGRAAVFRNTIAIGGAAGGLMRRPYVEPAHPITATVASSSCKEAAARLLVRPAVALPFLYRALCRLLRADKAASLVLALCEFGGQSAPIWPPQRP